MKKTITTCDACGKQITPDPDDENIDRSNGWTVKVPQGSPDNKLNSIDIIKFEHLHFDCSMRVFNLIRSAVIGVVRKECATEFLIDRGLYSIPKKPK